MQVRYPPMNFADVQPHWAPNKEFAQQYNAFSLVPAYIEPFLVKVMMRAKQELQKQDPVKHKDLIEEVDIFIKQEVQHCKRHLDFNKQMHSFYPGMVEIEKEYEADYARFLKEESLEFLCAYSEGFEAMGSTAGQFIFTQIDDLLEGADPRVVDLWKWHLAEEFEHREITYKVFNTLYGKGFFRGYFARVNGAIQAVKHIRGYVQRMTNYLLEEDRKGMSPEERNASIARAEIYSKRVKAFNLPRMVRVILPFYNPARKRKPAGMDEYLKQFEGPRIA